MAPSAQGGQPQLAQEFMESATDQYNLHLIDDANDDWVSLMLSDTGLEVGVDSSVPLASLANFSLPDLEDLEFNSLGSIPSSCCNTSSTSSEACFDDILCSFEEGESATAAATTIHHQEDMGFDATYANAVLRETCQSSPSQDCLSLCHSAMLPTSLSAPGSASHSPVLSMLSNTDFVSDGGLHGTSSSTEYFGASHNGINGVSFSARSPESGLTQGSNESSLVQEEAADVNIAVLEGDASGSDEDSLSFLVNDICSEGTGSTGIENGHSSFVPSMVSNLRDPGVGVQGSQVFGDDTLYRPAEMEALQVMHGQQQFPCGSESGTRMAAFDRASRKRKAADRKSRSSTPEDTAVDSFERSKDGTKGDEAGGEDDEKRQIRLMRNRESAQLSRQRKKVYVDELEERIKTMSSTIAELNNTINLISAENINLRRQLGFFCHPPSQPGGIPVAAPWVPVGAYPGPMMGGRFMAPGSQVPLVPIPRWKSQQTTVKKSKKSKPDAQEKGTEAKASKRTKKVAGVAVMGFFFFMFVLLPFNFRFLGLKTIGREDGKIWPGTWDSRSSNLVVRAGGRVLTGWNEEENSNSRPEEPRTGWASLGSSRSGMSEKDSQVGSHRGDWQTLTGCHRGEVGNTVQPTKSLHNGHAYQGNGSEPLAATLFVPRNDRLVKIDGNLIIHSVLAGDKAAIESHELLRGREELKSKGPRMQELDDKGLALDANLKALAVKVGTQEKGALVELQRALAANSRFDHDREGVHSVQEDGSLQQWFVEGLAGPVFSSGMCTEVFQFETSAARPSAPSSTAASHGSETNDFVKNSTERLQEHGPRRAGRRVQSSRSRVSYAVPLPPAKHEVAFDGASKKSNATDSTETIEREERFTNQKGTRSSMVVSVLAGSPELGDQARLSGGTKGLSQIFVVVLVDSVKYVTYSCMLPSKGSQPQFVTS